VYRVKVKDMTWLQTRKLFQKKEYKPEPLIQEDEPKEAQAPQVDEEKEFFAFEEKDGNMIFHILK
jgi:hypothetical protein